MIGKLSEGILDSFLETIPIEFSVLDHNDQVIAWNRHKTRIFKRPDSVLGKNVRDCHPKKSINKVEQIIQEMKSQRRDKARFWIDLPTEKSNKKRKVLIEYFAIRNEKGQYLGCMEASRDITDILAISGEKRLID